MKIYNVFDDKNRFVRFKATIEEGPQEDIHTFSYLTYRNQFKKMGQKMGLENEICTWKRVAEKDRQKSEDDVENISLDENKPCYKCYGYDIKCKSYEEAEK